MKCPSCGYEHTGHWESKGYVNDIGDKEFIYIHTAHKLEIDNPKKCEHGDYDYQDKVEVSIIACPKCKTVILNDDLD